jgi:hypothetical protein
MRDNKEESINTAGMDQLEVFFQIRELQMTRTMRELEAGPLLKPQGH